MFIFNRQLTWSLGARRTRKKRLNLSLWLNYLSVTWVFWHILYTPEKKKGQKSERGELGNVLTWKVSWILHFFLLFSPSSSSQSNRGAAWQKKWCCYLYSNELCISFSRAQRWNRTVNMSRAYALRKKSPQNTKNVLGFQKIYLHDVFI